jgi:hypothetical protein
MCCCDRWWNVTPSTCVECGTIDIFHFWLSLLTLVFNSNLQTQFYDKSLATTCNYLSFVTTIPYYYNYFLHLIILETNFFSFFHLEKLLELLSSKKTHLCPISYKCDQMIATLCVFKVYPTYSKVYGFQMVYYTH